MHLGPHGTPVGATAAMLPPPKYIFPVAVIVTLSPAFTVTPVRVNGWRASTWTVVVEAAAPAGDTAAPTAMRATNDARNAEMRARRMEVESCISGIFQQERRLLASFAP